MEAHDEELAMAVAQANDVFGRLRRAVEAAAREAPAEPIDVLGIARHAGLELDEAILTRLQLPQLIYPLSWLPWYEWWPYEPLWGWWWARFHPWARSGPYLVVRRSRWPARPSSSMPVQRDAWEARAREEACCGSCPG
jgi:hypothetical protein